MLLAALRRIGFLVLLCSVVTTLGALLIGVLIGASLDRSIALGFYLMGCFLLVAGFFVGNRGPSRVKSETVGPSIMPFGMFGPRQLRWATLREQNETILSSAGYITLGVILIVIGTLVDTRHSLY